MSKHMHRGIGFAPSWHRPHLRYIDGDQGGGAPVEGAPGEKEGESGEAKFTQADVDRIVKDRLDKQARNQFGDYDQLKAQAAGSKTLEQQFADLTVKVAESEAKALRATIASEFGVSKEDSDLFLTGSDEKTLRAQAERLGVRLKKPGVAPREGDPKNLPRNDDDEALRSAARSLFGNND